MTVQLFKYIELIENNFGSLLYAFFCRQNLQHKPHYLYEYSSYWGNHKYSIIDNALVASLNILLLRHSNVSIRWPQHSFIKVPSTENSLKRHELKTHKRQHNSHKICISITQHKTKQNKTLEPNFILFYFILFHFKIIIIN